MTRPRKLGRTCRCGVSIYDQSTTGMCKPCWFRRNNADPAVRRRNAATLKDLCRPGGPVYEQRLEVLARGRANRCKEKLAAHCRSMRSNVNAWLPDEWRPVYRRMIRSAGYTAAEAKAIILDHMALERKRARDAARLVCPKEKETISAWADASIASRRLRDAILEAAR